ncbi:PQQ-dependent sugar dehydrogenase [Bacillus badius]|uniref:PQQ-dependent sugar dehydrogenase n=1 Tax=Bacillus badius TaxID=1455 RepID=UPI00059703EA|nr:PQQ-dependent sugar dehydrogenase [Bacillus badius]KIL75109.1 PQQ-dependent oxidoreductase, gdhB family [Bacillus badius]
MKKGLLAAVLLFSGCSASDQTDSSETAPASSSSQTKVAADNLEVPWTIAKQDESFFITERKGTIIQIDGDGKKKRMELQLNEPVLHEGEGGLLGFVLDDDFSKNKLAYAYHTYLKKGKIMNRIVQIKKQPDIWRETKELLADIPGGPIHNGGRLAIGPDGKLFATAGDAGVKESAQDKQQLAGKILRLNVDGSVPEDNPFNGSYVFSYGHRNPQGMAWDTDGTMYAAEHGQSAHDEINRIEAGKNYGWPLIEGEEHKAGMEAPLIHSGEETWAPSGIAYSSGRLFIATLRGEKLLSLDLQQKELTVPLENAGRLRDVYVNGKYVYVATNNTDGRGTPSEEDDRLLILPNDAASK